MFVETFKIASLQLSFPLFYVLKSNAGWRRHSLTMDKHVNSTMRIVVGFRIVYVSTSEKKQPENQKHTHVTLPHWYEPERKRENLFDVSWFHLNKHSVNRRRHELRFVYLKKNTGIKQNTFRSQLTHLWLVCVTLNRWNKTNEHSFKHFLLWMRNWLIRLSKTYSW